MGVGLESVGVGDTGGGDGLDDWDGGADVAGWEGGVELAGVLGAGECAGDFAGLAVGDPLGGGQVPEVGPG